MAQPVKLAVVLDTDAMKRGLVQAEAQVQGFGANMKRIGTQIAGAFVFGAALRASFDELKEAEKVAAQTAAAIKSTGGAAKVSAEQVADLSSELSKKSGIDDELIQSGANLLLTFTKVRNEVGEGNDVFDRATEAALDLSVAGFGSVEDTAKQLGKALQDPITGMTALRRAGVTFTEAQKETIRSLVATGDVLGAQRLILEEVERQVGGSAEAYGETLPGQLDKARNALEEAGASMLGSLAPAMESLAGLVSGLAEAFTNLPTPVQNTAVALGATAFVASTDTFKGMADGAKSAATQFGRLKTAAGGLSGLFVAGGALAAAAGIVWALTEAAEAFARSQAEGAFGDFADDMNRLNVALQEAATTGELIGILEEDLPKLAEGFDQSSDSMDDFLNVAGVLGSAMPLGIGNIITMIDIFDDAADSEKIAEFARQMDSVDQSLADLARNDPAAAARAFRAIKDELISLGATPTEVAAAFNDYRDAQRDAAQATGETTDEIDPNAEALEGLADAFQQATDEARDYFDMMNDNLGNSLAWEEAWDDLAASIAENGNSLDRTEEQGRNNIGALQDLAQAALDNAFAHREQTNDLEGSKRMLMENVDALIAHATELGYDEQAVRDLIAQMGLTPEQIETLFQNNLPSQWPGVNAWTEYLNSIDGRVVTTIFRSIYEGAVGAGAAFAQQLPRAAIGGPVTAGRPYMVGEQGPELFVPGSHGSIVPNNKLNTDGGGGGQVAHVYLDGKKIAEALFRREKAMR